MNFKYHLLHHGQAACGVYCEHNKLTVHVEEVTCQKCQQTNTWKKKQGTTPINKPGRKPSDLVKKTKAWSMSQELWDWLESQSSQSQAIVESLIQYRDSNRPLLKPKISSRDKIKNFLRDNPGWQDSYTIAEALNLTPQNIQHLCKAMKRSGLDEKRDLGRSARNLYRLKEEKHDTII